jgi:hypothetical protein
MTVDQMNELYNLKIANRDIVTSVKNVGHIQANMEKSVSSANRYIREEYNGIRGKLVHLFRVIDELRETPQ